MENNTIFLISVFLVMLIALEHIVICGLEIFASPEKQANMFDMPLNMLKNRKLASLWLIKEFTMECWESLSYFLILYFQIILPS